MVDVTPYNILRHEFIGLDAEVAESKDARPGFRGVVVDETKNMLAIRDRRGEIKKFVKKSTKFAITTKSGLKVLIDGNLIAGRPDERIKKKIRIKF